MANRDLERALEDMAHARAALLEVVRPLESDKLESAERGGWPVRRVLQHLIESEFTYAKLLAHLCARPAPAWAVAPPIDAGDAARHLEATRSAILAIVDGVDDETVYRLTAVGHEEYSALSVLQNIAAHDRDHLSQIRALLLERGRATSPDLAPQGVVVRPAGESDIARIDEIYNHYVRETAITFDFEPFSAAARRAWFERFKPYGPHRLFVAEEARRVIAYAGSHSFRDKAAYATTVETTIYCDPASTRRGVGSALYRTLFAAIEGEDLRMAVAGITLPNEASVALHARFGFAPVGVFREVGRKFGRYWDVGWFEKRLGG
jgi:phosphinothricin acetyltransferase